jgi:hypothetical protein
MEQKQKRDYQNRYLNWEVIASFLLQLKSYEEVFLCFDFPSKILSKKIITQFDTFLHDIKLPKEIRKFCGMHCGGEPGLGRILDQLVFIKIYKTYLLPNFQTLASNGTYEDCLYVSNEVINDTIKSFVMGEASLPDLDCLIKKQTILGKDYKLFQYTKPACNRFIHRWCIPNRYEVFSELDLQSSRVSLKLTSYATRKGYPVVGWLNIPSDVSPSNKPQVKNLKVTNSLMVNRFYHGIVEHVNKKAKHDDEQTIIADFIEL